MLRKRPSIPLALVVAVLTTVYGEVCVQAKDNWVSVRSPNFFVMGNDSEKQLRQVATKLEQFRDVISRMFVGIKIGSPVPTTVIVFKNEESYKPFKLSPNNAGYFQPGQDVNYIAFANEAQADQDPFSVIFHEYTHLLVNNTIGNAPPWFNEGLAEYYSTFSITYDQQVVLGRAINSHVSLLRQNKMLPLRTLLSVDYNSPYYNERDKQSIFYAQSWALMHFLTFNRNIQRVAQVSRFLDLLAAKVPVDQAFPQAFQTSFEAMERELEEYVKQDRYPMIRGHFERRLDNNTDVKVAAMSEAEAQAYLGDLLVHGNRPEAEIYLKNALQLNPQLALAHASLGLLRFRQNKLDEARESLERAVAANSQNYLIHYYYALVLGRPTQIEDPLGSGYSAETAAKIRSELKKAIQLRPDFPESYNLLAFINLVTNTEVDESIVMLKKALEDSPGRVGFVYMLGQLYMNKDDYKSARPLLEQVIASDSEERVRSHAKRLIATISKIEEQKAKIAAAKRSGSRRGVLPQLEDDFEETLIDEPPTLDDVLRKPEPGESRLQGTLLRVDCEPGGLIFVVKVGDRLFRLTTDTFERIRRTTYDVRVRGVITCGPVKPENSVVICYVPLTDRSANVDGVLSSIEFVPADFRLRPAA